MFKVIRSITEIAINSAADCSIALVFGTEFEHGTAGILHYNVQGQRSQVKGTGSKVKITA